MHSICLHVSHRLTTCSLKTTYQTHVETLGQTGYGLRREQVAEGTALYNSHRTSSNTRIVATNYAAEIILATFPWWYDLDAMWHELPNFFGIGIGFSAPGVDHASAAKALMADADGLCDEEQQEIGDDPDMCIVYQTL